MVINVGQYNSVERTTISKLKTQEAKIRQANLENKQPDKKRVKVSGGEDVQKAMLTWFRQARSENIPINGPLLLEIAHSIAIQLGSDFVPNASWLERVKKRENISFNKLHGEKKAANFEVKPSTISNCFSKAGFEVNTESTIVSEDDEPEVVLPGISFEELTAFVDIDENYQTSGVFTDQEICEQILEQNDTTETTIIDDESEEVIPTTLKALKMIHAIRLYCTTLPNADNLQAKIDSIENAIESQPKPRKQSSLIDFFRLAK